MPELHGETPAMPPKRIAHDNRVALVDECNVASDEETHGLVDLAAGLVAAAWPDSDLAEHAEALYTAVQETVDRLSTDFGGFSDAVTSMDCQRESALMFAARLGFALARTSSASDDGWAAWVSAAQEWLQQRECGPSSHQGVSYDRDIADLRKWNASQSAPQVVRSAMETVAGAIGESVDEALAEHNRQHHAEPPMSFDRVEKGLTGLGNAVQESLEEHVRLHHADRPAPAVVPASDPSAPKTQPAVGPKRQSGATRAASAPPARHRSADYGHVAAAVPGFDQCAGDDLELAGHRHPRATDPWFANGAG